jgi:hypothetical protein
MDPIAPVAGRFTSAVRRRILVVRIAESIAISTAVASTAGLMVLPILWWRGQSALPLAEVMLGAGCLFGLIRGISRRPSRLQAAIEADTQLGLHDLLGTVVLLDKGQSGLAWQTTIAAFADERCRSLSPSTIIVNRIGLRGWAGVGILGGLLLMFALLTVRPTNATASSSVSVASASGVDAAPSIEDLSASPSRPPGPGGTDSNSIGGFQQDQPDDSAAGSTSGTNSSGRSSSGRDSSSGSGMSTTRNPGLIPEPQRIQNSAGEVRNSGAIADGEGQSDSRINVSGKNDSTIASESDTKRATPWTSATWAADAAAADSAVGSGRVPAGDGDLVRDYFRRD